MASQPTGRSSRPSITDAYAELLSQTRGLKREQQQAREGWYAGLLLERKEDILFELEEDVLLALEKQPCVPAVACLLLLAFQPPRLRQQLGIGVRDGGPARSTGGLARHLSGGLSCHEDTGHVSAPRIHSSSIMVTSPLPCSGWSTPRSRC